MYHTRLKGTHFEIGEKWGAGLLAHGIRLLDGVPFPITEERKAFAKECLPFYKKYYPEILEEIEGIEKGQNISGGELHAVLFCMYCIMPEVKCSCFAFREAGQVFLCRNSDFITSIENLYRNCIYWFPDGTARSFMGNTTAFVEMEDGVNEAGFAVGLTSVYPDVLRPGLNAGMLLRMGLEKCGSVEEFISMLKQVPIASSQTFTAVDRSGAVALIECNAKRVAVRYPDRKQPYAAAVNLFHTDEMYLYNHLEEDNWQAEERYETIRRAFEAREELGRDAGTENGENAGAEIRGKAVAEIRGETRAEICEEAMAGQGTAGNMPDGLLRFSMDLLSGKYGFLCQYDRKTGHDTVWSVVYALTYGVCPPEGRFYRCEGNPARRRFREDTRFCLRGESQEGK